MAHPIIFLHIPKTAGTTLTQPVLRHFPPDRTFILKDDIDAAIARFKALPHEERMRIRCLKGHQPYGLHEYLAPGARYITILREPVARIVSHYEYVKACPHHYMHEQMKHMTVAEYAGSRLYGELHNGQTRLLAGVWDDRPLEQADYDRAIAHLERDFDWIGLTERFDESLVMLAAAMRWPNVFYRWSNVGKGWRKSGMEPAVARAIERENPHDMALYEYARRRFDDIGALARSARRQAAGALRLGNRVVARLRGP